MKTGRPDERRFERKGRDHQKLDAAQFHIQAAVDLYREIDLAQDAEYAFQAPEWREGASGQRNCRISAALKERIERLRTLPGAEELG